MTGNIPRTLQETVDSAGTAQPISTTNIYAPNGWWIMPLPDNVGEVYVGTSSVSATTGIRLDPLVNPAGFPMYVQNAALIYIDAANNDDGIQASAL